MPFRFFKGSASYTSTVQNVGRKVDELLTACGWERVYVDPNAGLSGSNGAPGWGKSPTPYTPAGYVIYKMPNDGLPTRWLVRFKLVWGNNSEGVNWYMELCTGKAMNANGNDLDDPGSPVKAGWVSGVGPNMYIVPEWYLNAYESGFSFCMPQVHGFNAGFFIGIERKRTIQGNKTDRIVIYGCSDVVTNEIVMSTLGNGARDGGCIARDAVAGELGPTRWVHLKEPGGSTTTCNDPLSTADNITGVAIPLAPLLTSGGLGGFARLMLIMPLSDVQVGVPIPVMVDNAQRQYVPVSQLHPYRGGGRICIAAE